MDYFYTIKIEGNGCQTIEFDPQEDAKVFKSLQLMVDTVDDNPNDRSSDVLNRVTLKMLIDEHTNEQCKELMAWSLMTRGEAVHRTVTIHVEDNSSVIRSYRLEEMFVEDYVESFGDEAEFTLKLIQKAGKSERFHQGTTMQ